MHVYGLSDQIHELEAAKGTNAWIWPTNNIARGCACLMYPQTGNGTLHACPPSQPLRHDDLPGVSNSHKRELLFPSLCCAMHACHSWSCTPTVVGEEAAETHAGLVGYART